MLQKVDGLVQRLEDRLQHSGGLGLFILGRLLGFEQFGDLGDGRGLEHATQHGSEATAERVANVVVFKEFNLLDDRHFLHNFGQLG